MLTCMLEHVMTNLAVHSHIDFVGEDANHRRGPAEFDVAAARELIKLGLNKRQESLGHNSMVRAEIPVGQSKCSLVVPRLHEDPSASLELDVLMGVARRLTDWLELSTGAQGLLQMSVCSCEREQENGLAKVAGLCLRQPCVSTRIRTAFQVRVACMV